MTHEIKNPNQLKIEELQEELSLQENRVKSQTQRLRQLSNKLSRAERDERNRLSGLLHNHIQPMIVGARMQVWQIQRNNDPAATKKTAEKIENILTDALKALRSLSAELSPAALRNNGLPGGLEWLKTYMAKQFDFTVVLTVKKDIEPIKDETSFLLFEAVKELLLNAVKHANVNQADVSLWRAPQDLISLVVTDQGEGFDPALIERFSEETSTLGLFSIQERLVAIDGQMFVETAPGQGSTITLTAPAGKKQRQDDSLQNSNPTGNDNPCDPSNIFCLDDDMVGILIVDDHKLLREGLKTLFNAETDFHVLGEADSGQTAIEMAEKLDPDVVLMDVDLGDISGITATREILARQPGIRIIGLSMHDDKNMINAMYRAGAVTYLTKNAPIKQILDAIRKSVVEGKEE
jgi:CheY-like chemotaxis protein/K+-sensing histidine kinase KdpD